MPSYSEMRQGYRNLWEDMAVDRVEDADSAARGIRRDKQRYQEVEEDTGVPWFWVAIVHHRENGRDFGGVLHNGQRIIGTGKKTSIVPKGRGPFSTWEEAAIDAIEYMELDQVPEWSVERMLFEFERYNGFGYVQHGVNSPYVWAGTNLQQQGKFVADGQFDPTHWDRQLGAAAILSRLAHMDSSVAARIGEEADEPEKGTPTPEPAEMDLSGVPLEALIDELKRRKDLLDSVF